MVDKLFVATKAFILYENKVLLLRESAKYGDGTNEGKLDVPGGRLNPGERYDEALLREVREETGLDVTLKKAFAVAEWRPNVREEEWQIVGMFFECIAKTNEVTLSEDHTEYLWIDPKEYGNYPLIENLIPVFERFLSN